VTPVAITGIGVVSALGIGLEPFWQGLLSGRSGIAPLTTFPLPRPVQGGVAPPIEVRRFATSAAARRIDRASLLALAACRLALEDGGAPAGSLDAARSGLVLGSAFGNLAETAVFLDRLFARGAGNPLVFPNLVMNAPLSYASIELGITGPTAMLTEQEASGEAAIAWGAGLVADGAVDVCLAGATDELEAVLTEVLHDAGVLARDVPRPFDLAADGSVPGEGAAVLLLERLDRARARGARIYGRVVPHAGFGVPASIHGWPSDPEPLAAGLAPLVADADVVVAAASGRPAVDGLEAAALARAAGPRRPAVTAPRGALGDFGAAGALGVAAAALIVYTGIVPPTLGLRGVPREGLDVVTGDSRRTSVRVVVVDGLARGGACRPLRVEASA
jgi:3-oxoacyl-[acyl-carrier-protein] synthase II